MAVVKTYWATALNDSDLTTSSFVNHEYIPMSNTTEVEDQVETMAKSFNQVNTSLQELVYDISQLNTALFDLLNNTDVSSGSGMDNALSNLSSTPLDWEPWRDTLDMVNRMVLGVAIIFIMFGMGCTLYWKEVRQ